MRSWTVLRAWAKILGGRRPSLSIEVTRECPLKCPGCYAYEPNHLGGQTTLRQLSDFRGQELIDKVIDLVERYKPLHLSIVGGDPLVRYREMEVLIPEVLRRGVMVQLVTSAFRAIPAAWVSLEHLDVCVSVDGLPPEHDVRRTPATYERILQSIANQKVTIHCTITGQMMKRTGYLEEFVSFWSARSEARRLWFSLFTPQVGDSMPEILTTDERTRAIEDLIALRRRFPKVDTGEATLRRFATPPASPDECVFARTTRTISADLKTLIAPCQFGGTPDCSQCGCMASAGLAAVADYRVGGVLPIGPILDLSFRIGNARTKEFVRAPEPALKVLP
jgi:MoaA/NifB/PqqE/SkfB family radical SAM enzyme